ncbi:carbohydrate ABC transporter permease [Thermaerobacter sp. PB12/4term]|uniref:carbohydrate ABC transporter permease n=1 Tax=Thermaerobacter sp. PB12/4term TaxID=2293838 RepID=UPI00193F2970|nr:sugar ABC transporter permease [Thermaerobacter sp. PB12/4term]
MRPLPGRPRRSRRRDPLWLAAPALVLILALVVVPAAETLWLAFVDAGGRWAGLAHFQAVLQDPETLAPGRFPGSPPPWGSLVHNLVWVALHLPLTTGLGLALALLLQEVRGGSLLRSFVFLGMVTPLVVGGVLIRFLFDENAGVIPALFRNLGVESLARTWTAYPQLALPALILGSVWLWAGFAMVLYSAGLASIPRAYYEAALVDGAGWWSRFRHITWPSLRPVTAVVVAMTVLWELKIFDLVYTATQGGPGGASMVLALQMYFYGFRSLDPHRAAAVATLLTLCTLLIGLWFVRTAEGGERG